MAKVADLYQDFESEIVKSELQRSKLLIGVFSVVLVFVTVNYFFLDTTVVQIYGGTDSYLVSVTWIFCFIVFNLFVKQSIGKALKQGRRFRTRFKVALTIIEVSIVTCLILYMVDVRDALIFLDSPVPYVYFVFIILSILHLDFKLSITAGIVAAIEFALVVYYGFNHAGIPEANFPVPPENSYYLRCFVLVVSGAAAGFVSEEVKRRVKSSLEFKNQKKAIESLLGQQVSKDVLMTLTEEGGLVKKSEATVLALDIRNFSAFAESHTPSEIMEYQNKVFGPILDIITQHQGIVNQIMGDGIMATFGSPRSNPLHTDMAFQAAVRILGRIKELSDTEMIPATKIGIGIHTGEVVTGNIGNDERKQYSISGTAVIVAFRVEQLNKELGTELLITEEVKRNIVIGRAKIESLGFQALRGLGNNVEVYKVGELSEDNKIAAALSQT